MSQNINLILKEKIVCILLMRIIIVINIKNRGKLFTLMNPWLQVAVTLGESSLTGAGDSDAV